MKPLLIFQLPQGMNQEEMKSAADIICDGIKNGALILNPDITLLSFDADGNMNFNSRQK